MKAKEAPEKIYLSAIDLEEVGHLLTESNDKYDVEYTRTDAFIAKVERFLEYNLNDRVEIRVSGTLIPSLTDKKTFIEDFKNYMKGE